MITQALPPKAGSDKDGKVRNEVVLTAAPGCSSLIYASEVLRQIGIYCLYFPLAAKRLPHYQTSNVERLAACLRYLNIIHNHRNIVLLAICAVLFTGCATARTHESSINPIDPNEEINRKFYNFTDTIDRNLLAPVADVYIEYVPDPMVRSIGNFYDNLAYPNVILNDFLQGKVHQGFQDSLRFVINSTVGLGGFFDIAAPMGLPQHDEDVGQTLGVWGVSTGSYLFVPLIGPSTYRDAPGIPISAFSNLLFYAGSFASSAIVGPITILSIIDKRARLSGPMRIRDQAALDPYLFVREGFLQQRKHLIYDGEPPPESYDDPMDEDFVQNELKGASSP